ncbi:DUF91 domain-containing protein [Candidatus Pacearchaeota archaeon]|nr:DUF91 domain-containing protein [Candidatus Pacearchaeota archaeon]
MVSNLIKIKSKKELLNMNEIDMHPEEEIEEMLWNNKILSDIYLLNRQVPSYDGSKKIDILGLDNDNNIVIIEVKDEEADEDVILQVMRYAFWVETNPDSVKSLYLEKKDKEEGFGFEWNQKSNIRILIVAPSFTEDVRKLISRVKYNIELIELKKFNDGESDLIFINQIETEENPSYKPSVLRYTGEYGEEFYKTQRNEIAVPQFMKVVEMMESYLKQKGWNLKRKQNQSYIAFKSGFPIVCGVEWIGSKSFALFFKVPKEISDRININNSSIEKYDYSERWNQIDYKIISLDFLNMKEFDALFEASYKNITGK